MFDQGPRPSPIPQVLVSPVTIPAAVTQDQAERLARLRAAKTPAPASQPAGVPKRTVLEPKSPRRSAGSRRKSHPARGARAIALAASVTATVGVGGAMAYADAAEPADSVSNIVATATALPTTVPLEIPVATTGTQELLPPSDPGALEALAAIVTPETAKESAVEEEPIAASPTPAQQAAVVVEPEAEADASPAVEASPAAVATNASGLADGVFNGTAEYTEWGNVQVQVTIVDGNIVDIAALQMPSGRKSSDINDAAVPVLEAQAVATQSSDLDIVSGATYTSATYEDSLQAALDQAALAQQSMTQDAP